MKSAKAALTCLLMFSILLFRPPFCRASSGQLDEIRLLMAERKWDAALGLSGRSVADQVKADYLRAVCLYKSGRMKQAIDLLSKIENNDKKETAFKAAFLKARIYLGEKNFSKAEAILREQSGRLLSDSRKRRIAGIYFALAEAAAGDTDKPDFEKAIRLYSYLARMKVPADVLEKAMFLRAKTALKAKRYSAAVGYFTNYLNKFDPFYTKELNTGTRGKENEGLGENLVIARLSLIEASLRQNHSLPGPDEENDYGLAVGPGIVMLLENLVQHLRDKDIDVADIANAANLDTALYYLPLVYGLRLRFQADGESGPSSPAAALRATEKAEAFISKHPSDRRSIELARLIPRALLGAGFTDRAIAEFRNLSAGKGLKPKNSEDRTLLSAYRAQALNALGRALYRTARYEEALSAFRKYLAGYPNGRQWKDSQEGLFNSLTALGAKALAECRYDEARTVFSKVLKQRALVSSTAWLSLVIAASYVAQADDPANSKNAAHRKKLLLKAIDQYDRAARRYGGEVASHANFYKGEIFRTGLKDLQQALEAYRLSSVPAAREAAGELTGVELELKAPRVFRSNETAKVHLSLRNVEELTLRLYRINLLDFFKKYHSTMNIRRLDLDLVSPDRVWKEKIASYSPLKDISLDLPVKLEGPGSWALTVEAKDYEATVLVIKSDIEVVAATSRDEVIALVKNAVSEKPVEGADIQVWAGGDKRQQVSMTSSADGVARGRFLDPPSVKPYFFVSYKGHVAVAGAPLPLAPAKRLSPRGYIYTSRPVYLPGEEVPVRGIIRGVGPGGYRIDRNQEFDLIVYGPAGGFPVAEKKVRLNEFGTFTTSIKLFDNAPLGRYTISAGTSGGKAFSSTFQVQLVSPSKVYIELTPSQAAVSAGDKVRLTLRAAYYTGSPLVSRRIDITLPDDRKVSLTTDDEGVASYTLDTSAFFSSSVLEIFATLPGESVSARTEIRLLPSALTASFDDLDDKLIVNERVSFSASVKTAAGSPVAGRPLLLSAYGKAPAWKPTVPSTLLRRAGINIDGLFGSNETLLFSRKALTDRNGSAAFEIAFDSAGDIRLVLSGKDDNGRDFTRTKRLKISRPKSPCLVLGPTVGPVRVGEQLSLPVDNKEKAGLCLVLFTGEGIIGHKVRRFRKGKDRLNFTVDDVHYPGFSVILLLNGQHSLNRAERRFTVRRSLKLELDLPKGPLCPGSRVQAIVQARDHRGTPVETELSLSMVDEALLKKYPDQSGDLVEYFEKGLERRAFFTACSSISYERTGKKRKLARQVLEEKQRLEEERRTVNFRRRFSERVRGFSPSMKKSLNIGRAGGLDDFSPVQAEECAAPALFIGPMKSARRADKQRTSSRRQRRELRIGAFWIGKVRTDKNGRAVVSILVPQRTSRYKLLLRGVTKSSLLAQLEQDVTVRKTIFADLKLPVSLIEGDRFRALITVHNNCQFKGMVKTRLSLRAGELSKSFTIPVRVTGRGAFQVVAPEFSVPASSFLEARLSIKAADGQSDSLSRRLAVRPWGAVEQTGRRGSADSDVSFSLKLPGTVRPGTVSLTMSLSTGLFQGMMSTEDHTFSLKGTACRLLAFLELYRRRKSHGIENSLVLESLQNVIQRDLAALLAAQGTQGGWFFTPKRNRYSASPDLSTTAWALTALARALHDGVLTSKTAIRSRSRAENFLMSHLSRGNIDKSLLEALLALSCTGKAKFSQVNRLYRQRFKLGRVERVLLALCFVEMKKTDYAMELAGLTAREVTATRLRIGRFGKLPSPGGSDDIFWKALALRLFSKLNAFTSERTRLALALSADINSFTISGPDRWLATAAQNLATALKDTPPAFSLDVEVNGKKLRSYKGYPGARAVSFTIDNPGGESGRELSVRLAYRGRGVFSYNAVLKGFSPFTSARRIFDRGLARQTRFHSPRLYNGKRLCNSAMIVTSTALDDFVEDYLGFETRKRGVYPGEYVIVQRYIPGGMTVDPTSLPSDALFTQRRDGCLVMLFRGKPRSHRLRLLPVCPGVYRCPPTEMYSLEKPADYERLEAPAPMKILPPGERVSGQYKWTESEHIAFGTALFRDHRFRPALAHLSRVNKAHRIWYKNVVKNLLWIYCMPEFYQAKADEVIDLFEILADRYPNENIPYEKLLVIGRAYHDSGEDEAACYLWNSMLASSFRDDVPVAAELENAHEYMRAVSYLRALFWSYPDLPTVVQSLYGLSQDLYTHKDRAREYGLIPEKFIADALDIIYDFLALFPDEAYADEAVFSELNAYLELHGYNLCLKRSKQAVSLYPKSSYIDRFRYIRALAAFHLQKYDEAIDAALAVGKRGSHDGRYATYLVGQMYQALGKTRKALEAYRSVQNDFYDARLSIEYLERKSLSLPEIITATAGAAVELELTYCNVDSIEVMSYRVDLMRLYLKEKNLDRVAGVNLAGIRPTFTFKKRLPPIPAGTRSKSRFTLPIEQTGAYLVLARSGGVFASSLALVSPLSIEVQELEGAVRATVLQGPARKPAQGVYVKASAGGTFVSGRTDLRGCVTLKVSGESHFTVVARRGKDEYCFYRSPAGTKKRKNRPGPYGEGMQQVAYDKALKSANLAIQSRGAGKLRGFFGRRALDKQGVQAAIARK